MRHALTWMAVLAIVSGCGRESAPAIEPTNGVFPDGSRAVVIGDKAMFYATGDYEPIASGTRITVRHDPGDYQEDAEDLDARALIAGGEEERRIRAAGPRFIPHSDPESSERKVSVVIDSGPKKGAAGFIRRSDLRPLTSPQSPGAAAP